MFKIRKTAALAALFCSSVLNAWASADHMVIAMPQIPTIIEPVHNTMSFPINANSR